MDDVDKAITRLEAQGFIERVEGAGSEEDPVYRTTPKGRADVHDRRVQRLINAVLDWSDLRGVDVDVEEEPKYLAIDFDGEWAFDWHWDFDDRDLWQCLDERLEELRPAGTRCLPGGLTLDDLEEELADFNTDGPLTIDLYRSDALEYRVKVKDEVTNEIESFVLTWTPEMNRDDLLETLTNPIKDKLAAIRERSLSTEELDALERCSPEQQAAAEDTLFITNRLRTPVPLSEVVGRARAGSLSAHWKLRHALEELREMGLDATLN